MSKWACLKLWNWFIVPVYLKKYLCIVPLSFFMLRKYLYTPHNFILGVVSYPSYHGLGMRLVYDRLSYVLPVDTCLPLLFPRKHKYGKPLPCWCTERFVVVLVNNKKKNASSMCCIGQNTTSMYMQVKCLPVGFSVHMSYIQRKCMWRHWGGNFCILPLLSWEL